MRQLLNTLYVMSENAYLTLDGKNVCVKIDGQVVKRMPLHILQNIVTFSYLGASPALMGCCVQNGIGLTFCDQSGRILARAAGISRGNILVRRAQYRMADDESAYLPVICNMISAKLYNQRQTIERVKRNHKDRVDVTALSAASGIIASCIKDAAVCKSVEELRGIEGIGAKAYFDVFDGMILGDKGAFQFNCRTRRPPLDRVNAMLSFGYSILANDCASALESFGLDAYAGFMHRDRPGRKSLALDLMEEFRSPFVDRLVLTLINRRQVDADDFDIMDSGAVLLSESGRKKFLTEWQTKKKEEIVHPYLREKLQWGLAPFIQAQLLSRFLWGDLDGYPAFMWRQ